MLNIRKTLATFAVVGILSVHGAAPVLALSAPTVPGTVSGADLRVSVPLAHLTIKVNRSEAAKALKSPYTGMYDAQALAFLTVYAKGWKLSQWNCLNNLWNSESHFNPKALNHGSQAYGIAQFLPSTWGNYKVSKTAVPSLQIQYGLHYIATRYGNKYDTTGACNAWNFHQRKGWY